MSHEHQLAIRMLRMVPSTKAVLTWVAWHACRGCGIAWAGVDLLVAETCLSDTTVRAALAELRKHDLIRVLKYGSGGRGRATEYVVVPHLVELSTAKCGICGKSTNTLQQPEGIVSSAAPGDRKPSGLDPVNPPAAGPQPSVETEPSLRARAREVAARPNGNAGATTRSPKRRAQLRGLVDELALNLALDPEAKPRTDR